MRDTNPTTLTADQFKAIRDRQANRCACCGEVFAAEPQVDRAPGGAVVRALLCGDCKRSVDRLPMVQSYLHNWQSR